MLPDPNLFRRCCYVKAVSDELAARAASLRLLHMALSEVEFGKSGAARLSAKTWIQFARAVNLFIGADLSERDCNLCFVWARMASSAVPSLKDVRAAALDDVTGRGVSAL